MSDGRREVLERYFEALRAHDWQALAECLAEQVERSGPYLDVVRGRREYVEFLAKVLPSLSGYELEVSRIRELGARSALVELTETVDVDGVRSGFPELLLFDFDPEGRILGVDVYLKEPGGPPAR